MTGEIQRLVDEGVSRAEIAVFYRTNAQSRVLEDTLVRAEIGYQVIGGTKFYERAEIKDAIAYLTVLVNPQDVGAFTRIVNSPRRGIGVHVALTACSRSPTRWACRSGMPPRIPSRCRDSVRRRSRRSAGSWRRCTCCGSARRPARRWPSCCERFSRRPATWRRSGRADDRGAGPDREPRGAGQRGRRVRRLRGVDTAEPDDAPLPAFLQQIALIADADGRNDDEGLVTLMTLHNAKGLEYPIVFMIGCEEGVFPHSRALDEGRPGGGAAAVLRRHHAGRA